MNIIYSIEVYLKINHVFTEVLQTVDRFSIQLMDGFIWLDERFYLYLRNQVAGLTPRMKTFFLSL
ncbi:UNVERIFIED_ORG: hypothetical protein QFZ59_003531 [Bacillus sp. B2I3]|nr:hypothetical protein [Bacillus sp. B2I3]